MLYIDDSDPDTLASQYDYQAKCWIADGYTPLGDFQIKVRPDDTVWALFQTWIKP